MWTDPGWHVARVRAVQRALLNSVPAWALFLIIVVVVSALSLVALVGVRRWLGNWRSDASNRPVAAVGAKVMTLFALVLAFVVVNLYESYQSASSNVVAEADSLSQLSHDSLAFPRAEQTLIGKAVVAYILEVRDREFADLRDGHQDPVATDKLEDIFTAVQQYSPRSQTQIAFYDAAVEQLNEIVQDHRDRVHAANTTLPAAIVMLLVLTALLSIGTTLLFRADTRGLEMTMVLAVAVVVAAGLATTLLLEYPFSGSLAVSQKSYSQGYLGQILVQYR
jgi:uncharacterized protein (DUF983 family)